MAADTDPRGTRAPHPHAAASAASAASAGPSSARGILAAALGSAFAVLAAGTVLADSTGAVSGGSDATYVPGSAPLPEAPGATDGSPSQVFAQLLAATPSGDLVAPPTAAADGTPASVPVAAPPTLPDAAPTSPPVAVAIPAPVAGTPAVPPASAVPPAAPGELPGVELPVTTKPVPENPALVAPQLDAPAVDKPIVDKLTLPAKRTAPTHDWIDGDARRLLWPEPTLRADFSVAPVGKSVVLRRADGPLKNVPATLQSPVFRDEGGRLRALPGGVVAVTGDTLEEAAVRALLAPHGAPAVRRVGERMWLVSSPPGLESLELANRLAASGAFESAQPNWWVQRTRK